MIPELCPIAQSQVYGRQELICGGLIVAVSSASRVKEVGLHNAESVQRAPDVAQKNLLCNEGGPVEDNAGGGSDEFPSFVESLQGGLLVSELTLHLTDSS